MLVELTRCACSVRTETKCVNLYLSVCLHVGPTRSLRSLYTDRNEKYHLYVICMEYFVSPSGSSFSSQSTLYASGSKPFVADRFSFRPEPCGGSSNCRKRDCKQLQNKTGNLRSKPSSLHVDEQQTLFNAHRRSLSSVTITVVHGLHLQDYRATNLYAIECARSAHLRPS